ncbi:MAG: fumarylacetoacetate hydrolase family protein [Rhodospirillaceae bacterium]|jgi:2,4-didehydro-3-deoxy-L-rhamnonate hydrolase|nr:fumarylacetoacetate hydrolase family protein [Rhodospirillaceae bacterium]MBT4590380.1 fumarylacetoacetate hydrolase family protein [Rhodospirillaceae bacterium]MBT4941179.1 fumarylacetoacetate hydrolase family protein [Rhodospirillaceae bacterium]MBT5938661.1 fumarylacetoacetate hydrolase family protein [Rhodospirillaceae bacterium]
MKLCRFDDDQLGLIQGESVLNVSQALVVLPSLNWPYPHGDQLIANLDAVMAVIKDIRDTAPAKPLSEVKLLSLVANPMNIVGAPINYQKHIDESNVDDGIVSQRPITNIWDWGMFLKSNSSLVGASEGVALRFVENRNDHEVELAVIIGKAGTNITAENALDHVAGYAIGLDMTTRGKELQSFRKSSDSYSVLGPWMVTKDEIEDPNSLDLNISVNGEERQSSNTDQLVYNVQQCIEYTTTRYTVYPGDIIMTGTPEGVGPVEPGDIMTAEIEKIGKMEVAVRAA